ncbi:MAG: Bug family tripartite tricarboxylate transporter substrate binding protein [Burkholderiales bacterium]
MPIRSKIVAALAFCPIAMGFFTLAQAQTFPAKPVRIVIPFAAGGAVDTVGRMVGAKLSEAWKQAVVVENRPGAGGIIAADTVAKSPPDGHTSLLATIALAVTPSTYRKLPYDPIKDLVPLTQITAHSLVLTVNPKLGVGSFAQLIDLEKSKRGSLSYGTTGTGTSTHLLIEMLNLALKTEFVHIPYKGDAPQVAAMLGGEVQLGLVAVISVINHIQGGKLKPVGVTGNKRSPLLPEVPTMAENGIAGFETGSWMGLFVPAGVPGEVMTRFQGEVAKVIALPDMRERFAKQGFEGIGNTPQEFNARYQADATTYARVVREAKIPPQE